MRRMWFLCTAVMVWWMVGAAQAHIVWIKHDGDGVARAYFGEWTEDRRARYFTLRSVAEMHRQCSTSSSFL
jgi:hypothetical protein